METTQEPNKKSDTDGQQVDWAPAFESPQPQYNHNKIKITSDQTKGLDERLKELGLGRMISKATGSGSKEVKKQRPLPQKRQSGQY